MRKLICLIIIFSFFLIKISFSFESNPDTDDIGTGGREDNTFTDIKSDNLKKGKRTLKKAIKLKKKNKIEKANKHFEKALKYFILAYNNSPKNFEILNLLGFTYKEIGDLIMSEIYYQEALSIEP